MWASSDIVFHRQLRIGTAVSRRSTIRKIIEKEGRSGKLVFVHVDREIHSDQGQLVSDRQTIVYRDTPTVDAPAPTAELAPSTSQWRRRIDPDPVMLFRYSALTFNGHRIHYDHPYATGTEGYPGLVVHGPLIATLLLHEMVARHPDVDVASYSFRAVRPIFDTGPFFVCGSLQQDGVARLFASDESGALCMSATATLR